MQTQNDPKRTTEPAAMLSMRDMLISMTQRTNQIDAPKVSDTEEAVVIPTVLSDDDEDDIEVHVAAITERKSQNETAINRSSDEQNESDSDSDSDDQAPGVNLETVQVANPAEPQAENQAPGPDVNPNTVPVANPAEPQVENQAPGPVVNLEAAPVANPAAEGNEELPIPELSWKLERVFENAEECATFIAAEGCWSKGKHLLLAKGEKQEYRCNKVKKRGPQCTGGIHTVYNFEPNNPKVELHRKTMVHNHENSKNQTFKVSDEIRKVITDHVDNKKSLKTILHVLRAMDLAVQPRKTQIESVIKQYRRQKYGNPKADIMDFVKFHDDHKEIPEDEDKAFVVGFERSELEADDKWIRMFVSTKRLLSMSVDAECLHADGTYKTNCQNYPLIVIGTTDNARKFHLVGLALTKRETADDYRFAFESVKNGMMAVNERTIKARAVISDAAPAIFNGYAKVFDHLTVRIMCWYHVMYNFQKYKFNSQANRKLAKEDLNKMHLLYDEKIFDQAAKLFVQKWTDVELNFIQSFENSFIKQNKYWFNGSSYHIPLTNNGTESFNSSLKVHQLFWEKKPMSEFKLRLLQILGERSKEYVMDKAHSVKEVQLTPQVQLKGYEYSKTKKEFFPIEVEKNIFKVYVFANANDRFQLTNEDVDAFVNTDWTTFTSFEELIEAAFQMHCISLDGDLNNWRNARCTCPAFSKEYICKHVVALFYRGGLLKPPANLPEFLEPNPKRGRKAKAKKGLGRE